MILSHAQELSAIAGQLRAELDAYEPRVDQLVQVWDQALYECVADQFDRMRMYAGHLDRVRVNWIDMIISRFELTEELFACQGEPKAYWGLMGKYTRHQLSVQRLRQSLQAAYLDGLAPDCGEVHH